MCNCVVGWSYCRSAVCDRKYPETTPRAIKGSISVRNTTGQLQNKASDFTEIWIKRVKEKEYHMAEMKISQYILYIYNLTHGHNRATELNWYSHTYLLSPFSRARLFATPWIVTHQAPLSMGFSRQAYWSGLPCPPPGDLPDPGIEPPCLLRLLLGSEFFTTSITWEAPCVYIYIYTQGCHAHRQDHPRTWRRRLPTRQGERSKEEPAPGAWASGLQPPGPWGLDLHCLSCPVLVLWQPERQSSDWRRGQCYLCPL